MSQATLPDRAYVNSGLFSGHYLDERLPERDEWDCDDEALEALAALESLYDEEQGLVEGYAEDPLIDHWIQEVLDRLGFGTHVEAPLPEGDGFVDVLLYESPEDLERLAAMARHDGPTADLVRDDLEGRMVVDAVATIKAVANGKDDRLLDSDVLEAKVVVLSMRELGAIA